jgi:hypothetical protein
VPPGTYQLEIACGRSSNAPGTAAAASGSVDATAVPS